MHAITINTRGRARENDFLLIRQMTVILSPILLRAEEVTTYLMTADKAVYRAEHSSGAHKKSYLSIYTHGAPACRNDSFKKKTVTVETVS